MTVIASPAPPPVSAKPTMIVDDAGIAKNLGRVTRADMVAKGHMAVIAAGHHRGQQQIMLKSGRSP
jgi:hypothetical protein